MNYPAALLLLVLVFSLVQGTLLPWVFAEGFLLVFFFGRLQYNKLFFSAFLFFLAGFLFDLVQNRILGVSSVIFLFGSLLIFYIEQQFSERKNLALAFVIVTINLVRSWFVFGSISVPQTIITTVLAFLFVRFVYIDTPHSRLRL